VYGEGPERDRLAALARELNVQDKVVFRDFVPREEIAKVMADADVAIVPKRSKSVFGSEAASTKIMEFMSVGTPVIVSRTKIDSFYHSDATVKFYDSDDPDELAKAILLLYKNPSLRERLVANALVFARENSWDRKQHEYLRIVDGLVSRARGSAVARVQSPGNAGPD